MTKESNGYQAENSGKNLYGRFSTQQELDSQYNLQQTVQNFQEYVAYFQQASEEAKSALTNGKTFDYGPTPRERLTVYPSKQANSPVMLFIHGGYWRHGSGDDFNFIATGPLEAGFTVVIITYALAPAVSIPEITKQVRSSIAWTAKNISSYNGNPENIFLAGHSAGAHLAAMAVSTNWDEYRLAPDTIKGILAISGLYDLEPVSHTFIQPTLKINADQILNSSPIRLIKPTAIPITIAWGSLETEEFRKQSEDYLNAWKTAENKGISNIIAGADHFSILKEFQSAKGQLTVALTRLLETSLA